MPNAAVMAESLRELLVQTADLLVREGTLRPPARRGPSGVQSVMELMDFRSTLRQPRHRLLHGDGRRYSPGQACSRFFYFLSGSDRRDHIELYTGPLRAFSPDGVALGGSAHGPRLFARMFGVSLFERCLETLATDGESNRAVIPFYQPQDTGCGPAEAPCLLAALLFRRGNTLSMSVHMRAQEVSRLLAYDVFELTMLQELVAGSLGLELGTYTHGAFALHHVQRRDEDELAPIAARWEAAGDVVEMSPMPKPEPETRERLVACEAELREHIATGRAQAFLSALQERLPRYWVDLLAAAAAHAVSRRYGPEAALELETIAGAGHTVLRLELEAIVHWRRRRQEARDARL